MYINTPIIKGKIKGPLEAPYINTRRLPLIINPLNPLSTLIS